ncbi:1-phosphofructokinase [Senegalia massiliensis]|uniref:1-phosphofructokinase n=1 Tax=Senegalia massiliensis TaxID=1720316 RepID=UPI00103185FD|nr:1-phosphofructokinase [Senegalia massiliensis]
MIGTITLNPAVDRRYNIDILEKNTVKRTEDYMASAGGKGLNVSRVARILGEDVTGFGFLGGNTGDFIRNEISKLGINDSFTSINGTTRTCLNIIDDNNDNIEILEKGPVISKEDKNKFLKELELQLEKLDIIAISGSLPKGVDINIYSDIIKIAKKYNKKVILDTSGDAFLENLKSNPFLVKPNKEELENITGIRLDCEEAIKMAAHKILRKGAENILVSLGSNGMYFFGEEGNFKVDIPKIKIKNTVGSGDSSVAGFAYSFSKGLDIQDILKYANACGMSNAMEKGTGSIDIEKVNELRKKIKVRKI